MLKQFTRIPLILAALAVSACGPAGLEAQGQVTLDDSSPGTGGTATATAVVAATDTPVPTPVPPTEPPPTSEIVVQLDGGADLSVSNAWEGTWQITGFSEGLGSLLVTGTAESYVGKQATITSNSVAFDGQTCANVTFAPRSASLSTFLGVDSATVAAELGIVTEQVTVIDTTCAVAGFNSFVQADANTLIVNLNGTFFVMRK